MRRLQIRTVRAGFESGQTLLTAIMARLIISHTWQRICLIYPQAAGGELERVVQRPSELLPVSRLTPEAGRCAR